MSFQDKTFCPYYTDCENGIDCERALHYGVYEAANKAGQPVSAYAARPLCFVDWWSNEKEK